MQTAARAYELKSTNGSTEGWVHQVIADLAALNIAAGACLLPAHCLTKMSPALACVQPAERVMVEELKSLGWDAWSLHPPLRVHAQPDDPLKYRHGVTIMQRYRALRV